MQIKNLETN